MAENPHVMLCMRPLELWIWIWVCDPLSWKRRLTNYAPWPKRDGSWHLRKHSPQSAGSRRGVASEAVEVTLQQFVLSIAATSSSKSLMCLHHPLRFFLVDMAAEKAKKTSVPDVGGNTQPMTPYPLLREEAVQAVGSHPGHIPKCSEVPDPPPPPSGELHSPARLPPGAQPGIPPPSPLCLPRRCLRPTVSWAGSRVRKRGVAPPPHPHGAGIAQL